MVCNQHHAGLPLLAEAERADKLEQAHARVAWQAESAGVLLGKLRAFFSEHLSSTNFVLRPLADEGRPVPSLAVPQLPPEVQVRCAVVPMPESDW